MKTLFVQLSDLHCDCSKGFPTNKIDMAISALKTLGSVDNAVLIFTGDLTNSADANEFKTGRRIIGKFLKDISQSFNCGFIKTKIVPGNHDMFLPEGSRGSKEIEYWNKDEHLIEELDRLTNFFDYSKSKNCFDSNKLYDVKTEKIGTENIQFCLINSAPYSTRRHEDKQLHYLPEYVFDKLNRNPETDLKISLMHHSYEWCEWKTKTSLKKVLEQDDIVFFGHDHKSEAYSMIKSTGETINIIMGGRFNLSVDQESAFNALVYDSDIKEFLVYRFEWNIDSQIFCKQHLGNIPKKSNIMRPTDEYLNKLLEDKHKISDYFTDYYVLPKLYAEGDMFEDSYIERISVENIFEALETERIIRITGDSGSGKSSLLRYLYYKSIDNGYLPLLIEKRDYKDSNIEKMFKEMFVSQYGEKIDNGYDFYDQGDRTKQIIFIDDIDLISNQRSREKLFSYVLDSGRILIYTTKETLQDLENIIKERMHGKRVGSLELSPFYKETRDELVYKICDLKGRKIEDAESTIIALDYMIQCQTSFFSLTPGCILQYINFFLNGSAGKGKGFQTISLVFETNLRNSMLSCTNDNDAGVYLTLLEFVANKMYFEDYKESISISSLEATVSLFNNNRKANVNPKRFLEVCKNSEILKEKDDSFDIQFCNKNTYAYFVAKYLSRELEKNPDNTENLLYVMNRICFGINETIILFLSFIRSNTRIIMKIAYKAFDLLKDYDEWNITENNLPLLTQPLKFSNQLPSEEERKEAKQNTERMEKTKQEIVKFKGALDFNENDVEKERFVLLRSLKFIMLIANTLVDQYGSFDTEELELMSLALYSLPQKLIYAFLKPYHDNLDKHVQELMEFAKENFDDEKISEDDIKEMIGKASVIYALNVLNTVAYRASNQNTMIALREFTCKTPNYSIMKLMMEENSNDSNEFVSKAISLFKENHGQNDMFVKSLISLITRKHIMYSDVDRRQVDKLISAKVLSSKSKKELLLSRGKKEEC